MTARRRFPPYLIPLAKSGATQDTIVIPEGKCEKRPCLRDLRERLAPLRRFFASAAEPAIERIARVMAMGWHAVVDMPAIVEAAAIAEPMFLDDGVGVIHEVHGAAPTRLVEIARRAVIVARIRHMPAACETADVARLIAGGDEIGDQRLEALGKVARDSDRPGERLHGHHAAAAAAIGAGFVAMLGLLGVVVVLIGVVVVAIVPMGGLSRNCKYKKAGGRYKQSHYA